MLGFLTAVGGKNAAPLTNVAAADHFWRSLPRNDAVGAARAVCDALADLETGRNPNIDQLRALLALDRHARKLLESLLVGYTKHDAQSQALEKRHWKAAFGFSQTFGHAYGQFLRYMRDSAPARSWGEYAPAVLLGMFQHRQIEFLLRPFQGGQALSSGWQELHEAYQYAHSRGLLDRPVSMRRVHETETTETTLDREYIRILLLDLMNGGQFSPYDVFWADQQMSRWCAAMVLEPVSAESTTEGEDERFSVDLDGAEGLRRSSEQAGGICLILDPSPMLAQVEERIAALCAKAEPGQRPSPFRRGRELRLLRRLKTIYSPKPTRVNRRGERRNVEQDVQVIVGFKQIVRTLRDQWRQDATGASTEVPEVEEITITAYGGYTESPSGIAFGNDGPTTQGSMGKLPVAHPVWQLRDCSESGCRLHGVVPDMKGVVPGALLAMREREGIPWTLVVVRRLKKQAGSHVDLGVEYVGRDPRCIKMEIVDGQDANPGESAAGSGRSFPGLYLPESPRHPRMPIKTLIMQAHEFVEECCLSLQSAVANYTIRLKEPLEEQGEFTWLPYEVIGRQTA